MNATVTLDGVVRQVTDGFGTYTESDDVVRFENPQQQTTNLLLASASDLTRRSWTIGEITPSGASGKIVHIVDYDGNVPALTFARLSDAEAVLSWMRVHEQPRLGGRPLFLGPPPFGRAIVAGDPAFATLALMTTPLNKCP